MGAALIHADSQTDMTKVIGAFRDYVKASKTYSSQQNTLNNINIIIFILHYLDSRESVVSIETRPRAGRSGV